MDLAAGIRRCWFAFILRVLLSFLLFVISSASQQSALSRTDRQRAEDMLKVVGNDVRKHYYDPNFHGVNWDLNLEQAKARIEKVDTMGRALSEIAAALDVLNDSHTYFVPPQHAYRPDYGWTAQVIGQRCFIIRVRPGSDAESKGLRPGDQVLAINGHPATKDNFSRLQYIFNNLRPQRKLNLGLRDREGKERSVDTVAKFTRRWTASTILSAKA